MWYWYGLAWFVGFGMGGLVMQHLYLEVLRHESNKHKEQVEKEKSIVYEILLNQEAIDINKAVDSLNRFAKRNKL